jgi:peptidoglycan/xylan/chitin deacetylase (PgdA/CDA1 family)
VLRILAYHRVAELRDTPLEDSRSVSATPAGFARQMDHLARFYRVMAMPEFLAATGNGTPLPKRSALITFDDAYADFAEIAWPILKRLSLPATVFVPTAYPDHPELAFWWDRLYQAFAATSRKEWFGSPLGPLQLNTPELKRRSLRALQNYVTTIPQTQAMQLVDSVCAELLDKPARGGRVLSWDQLRELAREGLTLGSHTRTHPIMTHIAPEQMREEVRGSQADLKREIGTVLPIFCYPNGNHNDTTTAILKQEGIRLAFTTLSGPNKLGSLDLLRLRRAVIMPRTSPAVFCLRLSRVGTRLDAWRQRKLNATLTRGYPGNHATNV